MVPKRLETSHLKTQSRILRSVTALSSLKCLRRKHTCISLNSQWHFFLGVYSSWWNYIRYDTERRAVSLGEETRPSASSLRQTAPWTQMPEHAERWTSCGQHQSCAFSAGIFQNFCGCLRTKTIGSTGRNKVTFPCRVYTSYRLSPPRGRRPDNLPSTDCPKTSGKAEVQTTDTALTAVDIQWPHTYADLAEEQTSRLHRHSGS